MLDGLFLKHRVLLLCLLFVSSSATTANSARFSNKTAEFAGMDKITGRVLTFDIDINKSVQFGSLTIKPMVCYSRDDYEAQRVDVFVSISESSVDDHVVHSIFSGWMFSDSPAMNAIDHSIYDVWLIRCKNPITKSSSNSSLDTKKESNENSPADLSSQKSESDSQNSPNNISSNSLEGEKSKELDNKNKYTDLKDNPMKEPIEK
ncbi:DUF2155 domain-containing protein [Candidatus Liberibacter africanus]|nr:DUF2155 domain-containing protein [Candidatus Liberibacter africanus]QTP64103.1 DUF2155 domain-containing protein [Candidatus Liberibacter africanus]